MISIPAIIAGLAAAAKPVLVAVGVGAAVGGVTGAGACAVTGTVRGYHVQGEINREVVVEAVQNVPKCAAEGALVGGAFGGAGFVFAPAVTSAIAPVTQFVDDAARPIIQVADDAAAVAGSAAIVDDAASPVLSRIRNAAKSAAEKVGKAVTAPWRKWRESQNIKNALNYRELPKAYSKGNEGYVYVMKDVSKAGRYKIGKTTQPIERISDVKSKTGLKLDYTCIIKTDDMKSLEKTLFEEFDRQRRRNLVPGTTEIFILNAAQVASACSR
ncbi:MAG: GIY-YIG nuclease family protein [Chloroflexi bacterium]|nr:GIY-YIG nuclease family protein [Chloroflexota bacterium]